MSYAFNDSILLQTSRHKVTFLKRVNIMHTKSLHLTWVQCTSIFHIDCLCCAIWIIPISWLIFKVYINKIHSLWCTSYRSMAFDKCKVEYPPLQSWHRTFPLLQNSFMPSFYNQSGGVLELFLSIQPCSWP